MTFEKYTPPKPGEIYLTMLDVNGDWNILLEDYFPDEIVDASFKRGTHCKIRDWLYVTLYFDIESRSIGIKPIDNVNAKDDSAFSVGVTEDGTVYIDCDAFLRYHDIAALENTQKYKAIWDKEKAMLIAKVQ
jgi:hypothetical protein